jgi:hypothetical protein
MREKQALIEEVCAANPAALAEIGAKSENSMARVAAIRQSEAMRQAASKETGGPRAMMPGFVILIETRDGTVHTIAPPVPAPMIEVEPLPERELEPPETGLRVALFVGGPYTLQPWRVDVSIVARWRVNFRLGRLVSRPLQQTFCSGRIRTVVAQLRRLRSASGRAISVMNHAPVQIGRHQVPVGTGESGDHADGHRAAINDHCGLIATNAVPSIKCLRRLFERFQHVLRDTIILTGHRHLPFLA